VQSSEEKEKREKTGRECAQGRELARKEERWGRKERSETQGGGKWIRRIGKRENAK
jgi:hypothetical protein